ncbi:type III pantothenate kinase [Pirellulaceae bacterium SH449]
MILVDIGNSGLRAIRFQPNAPSSTETVWKLSWPASFSVQGKHKPQQQPLANQRWCDQDDLEAFRWLVNSIGSNQSDSWMISSVKQSAMDLLRVAVGKEGDDHSFRKIVYSDLPMQLDVDAPDRVGMDRLLSSWEAWHVVNESTSGNAVITVQAGTAVTVDYVSGDGVYRGGAIMPGLGLSLQLLAAGTEQLPWLANGIVSHQDPLLPGKNTAQAIASGVHASLAGGTSFLVERYRQELNDSGIPVVVTGGDADVLQKHVNPPCQKMDHMVLRGLKRLYLNSLAQPPL